MNIRSTGALRVAICAFAPVLAPAVAGLGACNEYGENEGGSGAAPGDIATTIEGALAAGGTVPEPPPEHPEQPIGDPSNVLDKYDDGTEWDCSVQKVSIQKNPDLFVAINPAVGVVYPGALVQGGSLLSTSPLPIAVKRGGGRLVLDLVVGGGQRDVYRDVAEMSFGDVVQAQDELLTQLNATEAAVPAVISTSVEIFESMESFAAAMSISGKFITASFKASVGFSKASRRSRVVGQLTQTYFTVKYEAPRSHAELFDASVTPKDLANFIGPGNPATYVDTVTYGRRAYFVVEADATKQELKVAVEAKFKGISGEASSSYAKLRKSMNVRFVAMGGPSEAVLSAISNVSNSTGAGGAPKSESVDADGDGQPDLTVAPEQDESPLDVFTRYLANQDAWIFSKKNPPVPISYVVRNVVDNRIVKVDAGAEYDIRSCQPRIQPSRLALHLDAGDAEFSGGTLRSWPGKSSPNNSIVTASGFTNGDLNGRTSVAMNARSARATGLDCSFTLGDYTIAAAVRRDDREEFAMLLGARQGFGGGEGGYLQFGWLTDNGTQLVLGHGNRNQLFSTVPSPSGNVIVVTHRAGSDPRGKDAWIDGVPAPKSRAYGDPAGPYVGPADCVLGTIGDTGAMTGQIGEIRAYRDPLTESERRVVECAMGERWGIPLGSACFNGRPKESF